MVVSQGHFLECSSVPVWWLASLLRQHDNEERYDGGVPCSDDLRRDRSRRFRFYGSHRREAQLCGLSKAIR